MWRHEVGFCKRVCHKEVVTGLLTSQMLSMCQGPSRHQWISNRCGNPHENPLRTQDNEGLCGPLSPRYPKRTYP